jgi:hypothetical protein
MIDQLLALLSGAGTVLDTPGAALRAALAGENPLTAAIDPSQRIGGRDLLERWGVLGANREGLDAGDGAGFLAEMLLDPTNLLGGMGLWKNAARMGKYGQAVKGIDAANTAAQASHADELARLLGKYMPDDVAAATKAVDETGKPLRVYHGTAEVFDKYDPQHISDDSLYGPGIYTTADPSIASEYADATAAARWPSNVRMQYLDTRQPFDVDAQLTPEDFQRLAGTPGFEGVMENIRSIVPDASDLKGGDFLGSFMASNSPADVPAMLQSAGYDSLMHTGGNIMGNKPHQVYIGFNPDQIYPPYLAPPAPQPIPHPAAPFDYRNPLAAMLMGHNLAARSPYDA